MLKSHRMQLPPTERHWLPWFGKTGKLAMRWACHWSQDRLSAIESTFEGFAATRRQILQDWTHQQWAHLAEFAEALAPQLATLSSAQLQEKRSTFLDASELCFVNLQGKVVFSSAPERNGKTDLNAQAVAQGLQAPFLHGPYLDRETLRLGATTSRFHDRVTLMFYQPVVTRQGETLGCLALRVPNDVLGDLIQREAGHIFHESGDNYLFMVESRFDPKIAVGTALSRSRFEDKTFSHGDNLKEGIRTPYGVVQVADHTELELVFNDPASNQLHAGVRETAARGENLFVLYPGYADYRHIPVIGCGVTFQLPGSPDRWGMMCEADLEEVYRYRSVSYRLMRGYWVIVWSTWLLSLLGSYTLDLDTLTTQLLNLGLLILGALSYRFMRTRPLAERLRTMVKMIRSIAEGGSNLALRLDREHLVPDETGVMAQWINSFIDNLDGTMRQVSGASRELAAHNQRMQSRNQNTLDAAEEVMRTTEATLTSLQQQMASLSRASDTADEMRQAMQNVMDNAKTQFEVVSARTHDIRESVDSSANTIATLAESTQSIGKIVTVIAEIADQTNLLALNAAIEAARAGEAGRGFAVVADEIRKLAERTGQATNEIEQMIANIQHQANQAVCIMQNGMQSMETGLQLAEAAASDNSGMQDIVQRLFSTIEEVTHSGHEHSAQAQAVAAVTLSMKEALAELDNSVILTRHTTQHLQHLMQQYQTEQQRTIN